MFLLVQWKRRINMWSIIVHVLCTTMCIIKNGKFFGPIEIDGSGIHCKNGSVATATVWLSSLGSYL